MSRKQAREKAFECLFGQNFLDTDTSQQQWAFTFSTTDSSLNEEDTQFVNDICTGVLNNFDQLKDTLNKVLKGYSFDELFKPDKTILLIATYELKNTETDAKIVINEAVDISKKYGLEKSPKFVNGVLAGVLKLNE